MSCSGGGGTRADARAATVTRWVLSARFTSVELALALKRMSLLCARPARRNKASLPMLLITSRNSSLNCFSFGATSLLSGFDTPSRYFHTSQRSSSGRPCFAHWRSRGTSTTCCHVTTLNITEAQNTQLRTVSTSTMLRTVSLDTAMKRECAGC